MLDEPVMKWMLHLWSYMPCLGSAGVATPHSGRLGKCADQTTGTLVNHHTAGSKEAALAPPSSPPQCGRDATVGVVFLANVNPHCGKPKLAQAQLVLGALTEGWRRTARSKRSLGHWHARDAAHEFWRSLREQDSLVGLRPFPMDRRAVSHFLQGSELEQSAAIQRLRARIETGHAKAQARNVGRWSTARHYHLHGHAFQRGDEPCPG